MKYHAYNHYKKNKRFLNIIVSEWDEKMRGEIMGEFKLRKQYSKNYQVVELEVNGDIDQYDVLVDWLDEKIATELKAIPEGLLQKDNSGSGGVKGGKKPYKKEYTPTKYTKKRKTESNRAFGTDKQWFHIEKEDNQEFLEENGYSADNIETYEDLKDAISLLKDNGMLY